MPPLFSTTPRRPSSVIMTANKITSTRNSIFPGKPFTANWWTQTDSVNGYQQFIQILLFIHVQCCKRLYIYIYIYIYIGRQQCQDLQITASEHLAKNNIILRQPEYGKNKVTFWKWNSLSKTTWLTTFISKMVLQGADFFYWPTLNLGHW